MSIGIAHGTATTTSLRGVACMMIVKSGRFLVYLQMIFWCSKSVREIGEGKNTANDFIAVNVMPT